MIQTGLFRYVRWQDVEQYHRLGWMMVAHLGPTHGMWSVLMWHCGCNGEGNDRNTTYK